MAIFTSSQLTSDRLGRGRKKDLECKLEFGNEIRLAMVIAPDIKSVLRRGTPYFFTIHYYLFTSKNPGQAVQISEK